MKIKECITCGENKPLTDYYKHKQMGDGHLNKCMVCTKRHVKERIERKKQDPEWVEQERRRGRLKYYRKGYSGGSNGSANHRWSEKFPEKKPATTAANNAHPSRPGMQRHHWSYLREHWTDIIWLSTREHKFLHRHLEYDQDHKQYRIKSSGELLDTREKHEAYQRSLRRAFQEYQARIRAAVENEAITINP